MKQIFYFLGNFLTVICLCLPISVFPQGHDVYLTGNIVDISGQEGFIQAFKDQFSKSENDFTFILNGDLVDHKINPMYNDIQLERLFQFIDLVSEFDNGKMVLMTGDRDWADNGKDGYEAVMHLESKIKAYIEDHGYKNIFLLT